MKRTQIRTTYYWFMVVAAVIASVRLSYLAYNSDKEFIVLAVLGIVVIWLGALVYTQHVLKHRPDDTELDNQFTILSFVFTLLPIVATYNILVNLFNGYLNFPVEHVLVTVVADVFFVLRIFKIGVK